MCLTFKFAPEQPILAKVALVLGHLANFTVSPLKCFRAAGDCVAFVGVEVKHFHLRASKMMVKLLQGERQLRLKSGHFKSTFVGDI